MRHFFRSCLKSRAMRTLLLLMAFLSVAVAPGHADDTVTTAQSVIRSQEEAFAQDDAAAAFTFAAPVIQGLFRTPEIFMTMVRNGYAPVYRHRSF